MSQWLADLFTRQSPGDAGENQSSDQLVPALMIELQGHRYVCDFSWLLEVTENNPIISYPEKDPAHIGVINLRGSIVPVLCLPTILNRTGSNQPDCAKDAPARFPRMVVFSTRFGSFAAGAEIVRKCQVPREAMLSARDIEIDDKVFRILNESSFQKMEEMAA